jgi:hypothetical protein
LKRFWRQFPWAKKFCGVVNQAYVSSIEPDLLQYRPEVLGTEFASVNEREKLILINSEFMPVCHTKMERKRRQGFFGSKVVDELTEFSGIIFPEENLYSTLQWLEEKAAEVRWVLSYYEPRNAVIIYKAPEGLSVPEWFEKQIEREANKFRLECVEIDGQA